MKKNVKYLIVFLAVFLSIHLIFPRMTLAEDVITGNRFVVVYTGFSREYGETVLNNCEKKYAAISRILEHGVSNQVKIILAKDQKKFDSSTNGQLP